MYNATMVADSLTGKGHRLSTMEVVMPRIILAEFNTHRMLSRNSASSRAIPFKKIAEAVRTKPFIPLKWQKDHPGMQGTEYYGEHDVPALIDEWKFARDRALESAQRLNENIGCGPVTKQLCNRLLEPFMWHKVLVSATEWENFYALRHHEAAEIHIQKVAELMLECQNNSIPKLLQPGEWHIPYGDQIDYAGQEYYEAAKKYIEDDTSADILALKIATARCAQTSYTVIGTDEKPMDYVKLIALHDRLAESGHWSPFEHCARAMTDSESKGNIIAREVYKEPPVGRYSYVRKHSSEDKWYASEDGWCGNFRGFIQYRKTFQNENRKDSRLINKAIA